MREISLEKKLNKYRNSKETNQPTVIKLDLRKALSKIPNKKIQNFKGKKY